MLETLLYTLGLPMLFGTMVWHNLHGAGGEPAPAASRDGGENEAILGTQEADLLHGRGGDDTISGLRGNDTLLGGLGSDLIVGGMGNDSLYGNEGDDRLEGGAGDDSVLGGDGDDTILGGDGDDTLVGASGVDRIFAGEGNDWVTIWPEHSGDFVYLDEGADTLDGGAARTGFLGRGGAGSDVLLGGAGADTLSGDTGDDWISGGAGADVLAGGTGRDWIEGGAGNDLITGGDGADSLFGGDGADTVTAGLADSVQLGKDADLLDVVVDLSVPGAVSGGAVQVADFQPGIDGLQVEYVGTDGLTATVVPMSGGLMVLLDGQGVAFLSGLQPGDLTAEQIRLVRLVA